MSTSTREAFLLSLGITESDVIHPDDASIATAPRRRAALGAKMNRAASPNSSSPGVSRSASLRGDGGLSGSATSRLLRSGPAESELRVAFRGVKDETVASTPPPLRPSSPPPPRLAAMTTPAAVAAAMVEADVIKSEGNVLFEQGNFTAAIQRYTVALNRLRDCSGGPITDSSALAASLAALYSNRSASYLQAARQLESVAAAFTNALADAEQAVLLRPSWFKGYARQGDVHFKARRFELAAVAYEAALQLEPRNRTLAASLQEAKSRVGSGTRGPREPRATPPAAEKESNSLPPAASSARAAPRAAPAAAVMTESEVVRKNGQSRKLWAELKDAVEMTMHEPTGDAYRLQQLEKFRTGGSTRRGSADNVGAGRRLGGQRSVVATAPTAPTTKRSDEGPVASVKAAVSSARRSGSAGSSAPVVETGDASRRPRGRRSDVESASVASPVSTATGTDDIANAWSSPISSGASDIDMSAIPDAFSHSAATAYQQKLLEDFRRRKMQQKGTNF